MCSFSKLKKLPMPQRPPGPHRFTPIPDSPQRRNANTQGPRITIRQPSLGSPFYARITGTSPSTGKSSAISLPSTVDGLFDLMRATSDPSLKRRAFDELNIRGYGLVWEPSTVIQTQFQGKSGTRKSAGKGDDEEAEEEGEEEEEGDDDDAEGEDDASYVPKRK